MNEIATRNSWKNSPIKDPKPISVNLSFTQDEFSILKRGFIPEEMEDKWFIFYEDGWIYLHRSWTGFGMFKAKIIEQDDQYLIKEIWISNTLKQDEECIDTFSILINKLLLKNFHSGVDKTMSVTIL